MSLFETIVDDGEVSYLPTNLGYTLLVVLLLIIFIGGCLIFNRNKKMSANTIAFSGMAIALAFATSFAKLIDMPMGGSVTLFSMLFIALIGYWYGIGTGVTAAVAYGMLQLISDPYIISVPQVLLDYILAFGALGLSGIFSKSKNKYGLVFGYLVGVLGRYFFSFLSGWIFFGMYASYYGFNSGVVYSLAYNGAYIGLEALITVIVLFIPPVRKALARVKTMAVGEAK